MDAIRENEVVIERMQERIRLLRAEVEGRGGSWMEFRSAEEIAEEAKVDAEAGTEGLVNGTGHVADGEGDVRMGEGRSEAWRDGTFQTGRIVNGEVRMDSNTGTNGTGGSLDDEALRRAMEERMRALGGEGDEEDGLHL